MPHSPGCHGRNHRRAGDEPCPAFAAEDAARRRTRLRSALSLGYCDYCGREDVPMSSHDGKPICRRCANRWCSRGWTGAGPGPEFTPAIERAREYADILKTMTTARAAREIGRTTKTVERYKALLRKEGGT
jgi:hypothetical protein